MKDDPEGVPQTGANAAHPVPKVHAVVSLRPAHRAVVYGKCHRITLPERYDLNAALHARPLLRQDKLPTCEVFFRLRKQRRDLDRECEIALEILVQAVEVARDILQQQRRRAGLTGRVASLEEGGMVVGITFVETHPFIPFVGHYCEPRIELGT